MAQKQHSQAFVTIEHAVAHIDGKKIRNKKIHTMFHPTQHNVALQMKKKIQVLRGTRVSTPQAIEQTAHNIAVLKVQQHLLHQARNTLQTQLTNYPEPSAPTHATKLKHALHDAKLECARTLGATNIQEGENKITRLHLKKRETQLSTQQI
jgi:hypothetical protein